MAKIRRERRPNVSATLAKKSRKEPELSLDIVSNFEGGIWSEKQNSRPGGIDPRELRAGHMQIASNGRRNYRGDTI